MKSGGGGAKGFLHAAWDAVSGRKRASVPGAECGGFRHLFARSPEAMALLDGSALAATNKAWDILFGGAEADFPGRPLSSFLPELSLPLQGSLPASERLGLRRDGSGLPLEVFGYPFPWNRRPHYVIAARDISGRKEREERAGKSERGLHKSREHLHTVLSNAPIVLFALDAKGVFTLCEGRGLEALGLRPGEAVGKSAFEIHRHAPQIRMNIRRALSGEEFTSTAEMDGLWFETHFRPVFKGYDEVAGVIGVGINVTDRRRAEDALRRSEEQLRHSRKMEAIGRVAGGVAHDFNNLLTAITGYAELLMGGPADSPDAPGEWRIRRKGLEEIRNAADRATALTRQLLAFSRRQVLSPKSLNLNLLVGEMDKMLRRVIRGNVELVTVLDPALGQVWADPGQMEQVILNLALNARDAMPGGGQVSLETANVELEGTYARGELFLVPGSYVVISVSDTGVGLDEEVKAHLFEPFFTTKEEGKGQGLALSAVYGIVKQSGGTIAVESEKGRGATFKVFLPRVDKEASPALAAAPSESLKGVETVLLVEDEEAVRTLVREILRMHGYQVLEAREGGEAILISQRHAGRIHLLLTDIVMANMSGKELAGHLKPLRPEMRVLFISGYGEESALTGPGGFRPGVSVEPGREGAPSDADAFLAKPFTPKTLATKVREVLDGKTVERHLMADQF